METTAWADSRNWRPPTWEKRLLKLPGDFEGSRNLLLVAFQREQQAQVDTWLREMKRFEEVDPGFRYYELPTIQRPNRLLRWIHRRRHAKRHSRSEGPARTITLYIDKAPFLKALGITDESESIVFWWIEPDECCGAPRVPSKNRRRSACGMPCRS